MTNEPEPGPLHILIVNATIGTLILGMGYLLVSLIR